MPKLKKEDFDKKYRFREPRKEGLVKCATCSNISGGIQRNETALCNHPERLRKVKIAEYHPLFFGKKGESRNLSLERVCDAYVSLPLPSNIAPITLKEGEGTLLGTQFADCLHVDANCPYVIEEQRFARSGGWTKYNRTGGIKIVDITEMVPGEVHRDMCDMPCCEKRLQFQIWDPNGYRTRVGIHPNAHDPKRFVRNGVTRHERKSNMGYEEAEAFFAGVEKIASSAAKKGIHNQISAVADYMYKYANRLGSRPLSEAVNPVWLWGVFYPIAVPSWLKEDSFDLKGVQDSTNTGADVWMYDERLFDSEKGLETSLIELQRIPEGIIPCVDSKRVFRNVRRVRNGINECFYLHGILKPLEDKVLLAKGLSHFLDIREVSYHAYEHMWGESGIGFSATASFHEE